MSIDEWLTICMGTGVQLAGADGLGRKSAIVALFP